MVELGWPALTVPEHLDGLGMGAVELAVVVEELGRVLAPGPFLTTVTQFAPVVAEAGTDEQQEHFLAAVATGDLTGTLALVEDVGSIDPARLSSTASPDISGSDEPWPGRSKARAAQPAATASCAKSLWFSLREPAPWMITTPAWFGGGVCGRR